MKRHRAIAKIRIAKVSLLKREVINSANIIKIRPVIIPIIRGAITNQNNFESLIPISMK